MELAAIAPLKLMEEWSELKERPVHMCLAQLALKNSKYLEWMRERVKENKTVILDNGAYEGEQVPAKDLVRLAAYLHPRFVVIPDTPNDAKACFQQASSFGKEWGPVLRKFGVVQMLIAHCDPGDWKSLMLSLEQAKYNNWAIGLSRLTIDFGQDCGKRRDKVIKRLFTKTDIFSFWEPYIHMFGFGGLEELHHLAPLRVNSIDTSAPIWRGLMGVEISNSKWPDFPFELDSQDWPAINESLADDNLRAIDAILSSNR